MAKEARWRAWQRGHQLRPFRPVPSCRVGEIFVTWCRVCHAVLIWRTRPFLYEPIVEGSALTQACMTKWKKHTDRGKKGLKAHWGRGMMAQVLKHGALERLRSAQKLLLDCIKRDVDTLSKGSIYYSPPGRKFYERRIQRYRETYSKVSARLGRAMPPEGRTDGIGHTTPSTPRLMIRVRR